MLSVNYPDKYKEEASRVGKKFKYYKVEPIDISPKKEEKPKEVKIGKGSGRISALENWRQNPQQGNINHFKQLREDIFAESFAEIIDSYLPVEEGDNNASESSNS